MTLVVRPTQIGNKAKLAEHETSLSTEIFWPSRSVVEPILRTVSIARKVTVPGSIGLYQSRSRSQTNSPGTMTVAATDGRKGTDVPEQLTPKSNRFN